MFKIKINISCQSCVEKIRKLAEKHNAKLVRYSIIDEEIVVEIEPKKIYAFIIDLENLGYVVSGYSAETTTTTMWINIIVVIGLLALFIFGRNYFPTIELAGSFNILLIIVFGILTSFHCISMCGPIALKKHQENSHLPYYFGRLISYTLIGFVFGLLGGFLSLNATLMGVIGILVGVFLILMGLTTINVIRLPFFNYSIKTKSKNSFVLGLLNGVLPCAILQIAWVYVLTIANPFLGAITMLIIAIISSLALFIFGTLGKKLTFFHTKAFKLILAGYVIFLGVTMILNNYVILTAENAIDTTQESTSTNSNTITFDVATYKTSEPIPVGEEVTLVFDTSGANGCNEKFTISFPDGQEILVDTTKTESITIKIEEPGTAEVVCWMGMQFGSFTVE